MRGVPPDVIDEEIVRLLRSGLIDDSKFALAWVEDRRRHSPRGRRMIRYELLGRGIDPESVDRATGGIDDDELAIELARARAARRPAASYEDFLADVGGFLRRRGFDYAVSARAVRLAWADLAVPAPEIESELDDAGAD